MVTINNSPPSIECIVEGWSSPVELLPGIEIRGFVSAECGASAFSTGSATFHPGSVLPYHRHEVSEVVTVLEGIATILVEGRKYKLTRFDCIHIPAGTIHSTRNEDSLVRMVAHTAFASAQPKRIFTPDFVASNADISSQVSKVPEVINRFGDCEIYELSEGAFFRDLFAKRLGANGICGGYGHFLPGASLPCHLHNFDESITIVGGKATCLVSGRQYELDGLSTAYVPEGMPHRFLNVSGEEMEMLWVYAGDEPDRTLVDSHYCSGALPWPPQSIVDITASARKTSGT